MKLTPHLLSGLISQTCPVQWKGDCPVCGYTNAFSLQLTAPGKIQLHCFSHCEKADLYSAVNSLEAGHWTPPEPIDRERFAADQATRQAHALRLWDKAIPLHGTIGQAYLDFRRIPCLVDSKALRFHGLVSHPNAGKLPAIIALVTNVFGSPIGVHRTYLAANGQGKATVEPAKASLGVVSGGAIRLMERDPDKPLVIGEGIETSASAALIINAPAWAAVSAGNLGYRLVLPDEVNKVIISVDPDLPGRKAAWAACARWRQEGRDVKLALPSGSGDFNDYLCALKKDATHD